MDEIEREERAAVVAEALSWQGTPYHHMATLKGVGTDCGQFLICVYRNVGLIPATDTGAYRMDWHFHRDDERYLRFVEQFAAQVPGPPQPADIVLYKFGRVISHGAIVIEWPQIIHAYRGGRAGGMVTLDDGLANARLAKRQQSAGGEAVFYSVWKKRREAADGVPDRRPGEQQGTG